MVVTVVPSEISSSEVQTKGALSATAYQSVLIRNANRRPISELIEALVKGLEVGSRAYVEKSDRFFIRTKALQPYSNILLVNKQSVVPIKPKAFLDYELSKGDILFAKDSNIGECCVIESDAYRNHMISAGLLKIISKEHPLYVYAFMKNPVVKKQLELLSPKGATLRHSKDNILKCSIPFPNQGPDNEEVIEYIEALVGTIVEKEAHMREKHRQITRLISEELEQNQKPNQFHYELPSFDELNTIGRLDAGLYTEDFKQAMFRITNYEHGCSTLEELGYQVRRGQNLQVSAIGRSIYSEVPRENYFTLVLPTYVSDFGTVTRFSYLGSRKKLGLLQRGDVLFGAEGVDKGRTAIMMNIPPRPISNIHAVLISKKDADLRYNIFIGCFLNYLKQIGVIERIGVGTAGGSVGQDYFRHIAFPNFRTSVIEDISRLYSNGGSIKAGLSLNDFERLHNDLNEELGIFQLNEQRMILSARLSDAIENIVMDRNVKIDLTLDPLPIES